MGVVVEAIKLLENMDFTRQELEITRLGRHINELRWKVSDSNKLLAWRAKRWQSLVVSTAASGGAHNINSLTQANNINFTLTSGGPRNNSNLTLASGDPSNDNILTLSSGGPPDNNPSLADGNTGSRPLHPTVSPHLHPQPGQRTERSTVSPRLPPVSPTLSQRNSRTPLVNPRSTEKRPRPRDKSPENELIQEKKVKMTSGDRDVHHATREKLSLLNRQILKTKLAGRSKFGTTQELVQIVGIDSRAASVSLQYPLCDLVPKQNHADLMNQFLLSQHDAEMLSQPSTAMSGITAEPIHGASPMEDSVEGSVEDSVEDMEEQLPAIQPLAVLEEWVRQNLE